MEYKRKKYAYDGSNLEYKGQHWSTSASDGDGYWQITKYTYDGSDLTGSDTVYGESVNWTDRADYFA